MAEQARVESIDAIQAMRVAMIKFAETANLALMDADGDAQRTLMWLENEARVHWEAQLKKRTFDKGRAEEALRNKKLFKDPTGSRQSYIDEEKALQIARKRLEEAQQKIEAVRRWTLKLQRDMVLYKGSVAPLNTSLQSMVPMAIERLGAHVKALEQYVALTSPQGIEPGGEGSSGGSMIRSDETADWKAGYDLRALRVKTEALRARKPDPTVAAEHPGLSLGPADAETLAKLARDSTPVHPDQTLLVAQGLRAARRIYLERVAFDVDDSGWFIAPLDVNSNTPVGRILVGQLLTDRPDVSEILALPAGTVVIMDEGGIVAVYNEPGENVWLSAVANRGEG